MSTEQVGLRLHPGINASVTFVILSAIAAAVFIIKRYCFPVNEATYRYSQLKHLDDPVPVENASVVEESDEDLLE